MDIPKWDACILEPNSALRWIECHPGTAGWLGAIGVLITIGVTAGIALYQTGEARKAEQRRAAAAKLKLLSDVAKLVHQVAQFLQGFPAWVDEGAKGHIPATDIRPDKAMVLSWLLYESRFTELDDFLMVQDLSDLRARLHRISTLLNEEVKGVVPANYEQSRRVDAGRIARDALVGDCASFQRRYADYQSRGRPPEVD